MLEDFGQSGGARAGWFGASFALAAVVYGGLAVGVVAASAIAREAIIHDELVQLEFAPPPEPPPPPVPPPPIAPPPVEAAPARLGRQMRPELEQPTEIPDEAPEESDEPLAPPPDPFAPEEEGDPNGTVDGVIGGAVGGTGTAIVPEVAPEAEPEPVRPTGPVRVLEGSTPPQVDRAALVANFEIPPAVRSAGIARITMVVRVTIAEDGSVTHVDVLRGHALIPNDVIVRAVERTHFEPARMSDGTPYAAIHTLPITLAITI
jgi:hypothetical protein